MNKYAEIYKTAFYNGFQQAPAQTMAGKAPKITEDAKGTIPKPVIPGFNMGKSKMTVPLPGSAAANKPITPVKPFKGLEGGRLDKTQSIE